MRMKQKDFSKLRYEKFLRVKKKLAELVLSGMYFKCMKTLYYIEISFLENSRVHKLFNSFQIEYAYIHIMSE